MYDCRILFVQSRDEQNTPSTVSYSEEEMKINFRDIRACTHEQNASKLPLNAKDGPNFRFFCHLEVRTSITLNNTSTAHQLHKPLNKSKNVEKSYKGQNLKV